MNIFQAIFDSMSDQWMKERAATQMTLGKFIALLENLPKKSKIKNICEPHSYRGYYSDLAFELGKGEKSVASTLRMLKGCMGKSFCGWKGGDFVMGENTPIWIARIGDCGVKIMGISEDGKIITREDD